jgi:hypothetical protein
MLFTALSLTANTLYAELHSLALAIGVLENLSAPPGTVVSKTLRNRTFLYYQYRDLNGSTKQCYIGPDDEKTQTILERIEDRSKALEEDRSRIDELRGAYLAAGGTATAHPPFRVIKGFADAGILKPSDNSAVLIGTHAFVAMGNMLGVRWSSRLQTQDIDIAADSNVSLAVHPPSLTTPDMLTNLEMGFLPIPSLNPKNPSTSYRVRGQELRVDLLTPLLGKASNKPVFVAALNAPAQPLRHLDFLLEKVVPALVLGRSDVLLVNVPLPERFAFHKLLVSESRPSMLASKAPKDRIQAVQLFEILLHANESLLPPVKRNLEGRGANWEKKLKVACEKCRPLSPDAMAEILAM